MGKYGNIDFHIIDAEVGTTETTIAHGLPGDRVPLEAFIIRRNGAGNVFRGSTPWDDTNIYLESDVAVRVRLGII